MDQSSDFRQNLKAALDHAGLTPTDLHKKTGVNRCYIYDLIQGRKTPGLDYALKLAHGLGLPLSALVLEHEKFMAILGDKKASRIGDIIDAALSGVAASVEPAKKPGRKGPRPRKPIDSVIAMRKLGAKLLGQSDN